MNVRQKEFHQAALGDFPCLVKVALCALSAGERAGQAPQPGAGEEGERKILLLASVAEARHGGVNFGLRILDFGLFEPRRVERGAAQSEMVQRDVKKRRTLHSLLPLERLRRAL